MFHYIFLTAIPVLIVGREHSQMRRIQKCERCLRNAVSEQRLNRHLGMPHSSNCPYNGNCCILGAFGCSSDSVCGCHTGSIGKDAV